jgi:hypothetical protein
MLNKVVAAKTSPYVIVRMQPPQEPLQAQNLPWVAQPTMANPTVDDDNLSDDNDRPMFKKVRFLLSLLSSLLIFLQARIDDNLNRIAADLMEKYPPGTCPTHPSIVCFHHRPSNQHFEIDRQRSLVWAAAIRKGDTTMDKIPITSNLFKAEHALKRAEPKAKETSGNPPNSPTAPAAIPGTPTAAIPAVAAPAMPAALNPAQYMFIPGQMPQMVPQMMP